MLFVLDTFWPEWGIQHFLFSASSVKINKIFSLFRQFYCIASAFCFSILKCFRQDMLAAPFPACSLDCAASNEMLPARKCISNRATRTKTLISRGDKQRFVSFAKCKLCSPAYPPICVRQPMLMRMSASIKLDGK